MRIAAVVLSMTMLPTAGAVAQELLGESSSTEAGADREGEGPAPEPTQRAPIRSTSVIEEIVVTAQKRESTLQDTAISLTALGGETLAQRDIKTIGELQQAVPNLAVTEGNGASTLVSIRGVAMNFDAGGADPTTAIHVDGLYQPRTTTPLIGIRDVERVEVLRGPQGTLYGRNATGGAVNFVLAKPTEELEGRVQAGISSFDTRDFSGMVSGPLIDGLLLGRIYAEYGESDGFIDSLTLGKTIGAQTAYGGTLGLRYLPLDDLTVDLTLQYWDSDSNKQAFTLITPPDPVLEVQTTFIPAMVTDPECCGPVGFYEALSQVESVLDTTTTNAVLTIDWDLGFAGVKSITGYQRHELLNIAEAGATRRTGAVTDPHILETRTYTEELNVSGSFAGWFGTEIEWIAGGFYFLDDPFVEDFDIDFAAGAGGLGFDIFFDAEQKTESYAGFGDATLFLTPSLRIFGGLRYSRDQKDVVQSITFSKEGVVLPLPEPTSCPDGVRVSRAFDDLTPRMGVQWDVTDWLPVTFFDDLMLYGSRAEGYLSGGVNLVGCSNTYEPAEVTSHEVGFKSTLFGGRLLANFALFDNDYTNFQVFKVTGIEARVVNAPKASITGGELELRALPFADGFGPLANVSFDLGASVLDGVYDEFSDIDATNPDAGEQDLSGNELNSAPDYTLTLGGGYDGPTPFLDWGFLRLRGEWFRTADVTFRPYGQPEDHQDGYSLVNAYLSIANDADTIELRAFGKNLTETEYFILKFAQGWGERHGLAGPPRSFGASLTYRF